MSPWLQEAAQGVWIDTGFGNGSALQQVVDILQSRFDYYGFEPSKKHRSDAARLSENNLGNVNLSLELRGVAAHGKQNFASWMGQTHDDYAMRDGKPLCCFKCEFGAGRGNGTHETSRLQLSAQNRDG